RRRHRRGAGTGPSLQRGGGRPVHQRRARRREAPDRIRRADGRPHPIMSQGEDLVLERPRHLAALQSLGVPIYPNHFRATDTLTALVAAHGEATAEALEASKVETTVAGRILAIRSFGKANFLVLSDGRERIQAYIRKDALPERDFEVFGLLDFGD